MRQAHTSRSGRIGPLALAVGLGTVAIVAAVARFPEYAGGALVVSRSDASHDHRQPPVARRQITSDVQAFDGRDGARHRRRAPDAWTTDRMLCRNPRWCVDGTAMLLDRRREAPAALFHEANAPPGVVRPHPGDLL